MKINYFRNQLLKYVCLCGILVTGASCEKDEEPVLTPDLVAYNNVMLSSKQEVPENSSSASGTLAAVYDKNTNNLSYTITYSGTTPTGMHFHKGEVGVAGGVEVAIEAPYSSGMVGSATLTDAQEEALLAGDLYLNIHSETFPAGEIRGQVVMENKVVLSNVKLSGDEEVPSNNSNATGVFNGIYDKTTKKLDYTIITENITANAMHLHKAGVGVNGEVVMEISGMSGTTAAFNDNQEADLLAGGLYLNVHSETFPGGEIRGQVVTDSKVVFANSISGGNEVPETPSTAMGSLYAVYDIASNELAYTITFADIVPTAMHFHKAAIDANGDVELLVEGPYTEGMVTGTLTLSEAQQADLLNGLWYLNVHSEAYAAGEIRAQLIK